MVMTRPVRFIGVSGSWKTRLAVVMVTTSLNMPQILSVTTLVLFSRANSDAVIRKAKHPGNSNMPMPKSVPFMSNSLESPSKRAGNPSTGIAKTRMLRNMTGARKNIEENGFAVAGFRRRRICVRDHRKPEEQAEDMTRMNPRTWKEVSPATIMTTPKVMIVMMMTSRHEICSRPNKNANSRTKPSADDLHMAGDELVRDEL